MLRLATAGAAGGHPAESTIQSMPHFTLRRADHILLDIRENRGRGVRRMVRQRWRAWIATARSRVARSIDSDERWFVGEFGPSGLRLLCLLESGLIRGGVGYMTGGAPDLGRHVLHLRDDELGELCRLLIECSTTFEIAVQPSDGVRSPITDKVAERLTRDRKPFDVYVVEERIAFTATRVKDPIDDPAGPWPTIVGRREHIRVARLQIATWAHQSGARETEFAEISDPLPAVRRLRVPTLHALMTEHHDFDEDPATSASPRFAIDAVYTWVDDSDETWSAEKERFAQLDGRRDNAGAAHVERFRNRDELKYSLRSLELFAPWIRNIYVVTADQCPSWLDTSHPKINLISHRDIYSDSSWLPTFNSSSIETQLHHIEGLAEHFIYFNDDVMLGQLCEPTDFFYANGVVKYFESPQRVFASDIDETSEEYIQADRNAIALLQERFHEVGRSIMLHVPHPASRSMLHELEALYPGEFASCASSRFRSAQDLRPISFMQFHYGFNTLRALPAEISHRYLALWKPSICSQLAAVERLRDCKTLCINDVGLEPIRAAEVNRAVHAFLESYYPARSSFEL